MQPLYLLVTLLRFLLLYLSTTMATEPLPTSELGMVNVIASAVEGKELQFVALLQHSLPKSRTRTNIVTNQYTPRGRLFGGYTTRGLGATHATWRFPEIVKSIMVLARSPPKGLCRRAIFIRSGQCSNITSNPQGQEQRWKVLAYRIWPFYRWPFMA